MPSSISSSDIYAMDREVPGGNWLRPFILGLLVFLLAVSGLESVLAMRGFRPTVVDSPDRWAHERERASGLGPRAIVLIGASRVQLDVNLAALAAKTNMVPVQLAIDGNSFVPVLEDLASDDRVAGTVVVEYQDGAVRGGFPDDRAREYVAYSRRLHASSQRFDFNASESALGDLRQSSMRSYADGASPWTSLQKRAIASNATAQYLVTLPSRQRNADYTKVQMPNFYFWRVMRYLGITAMPPAATSEALGSALTARVNSLHPLDAPAFTEHADHIAQLVRRIEIRGGKVVFVMFPRSGLVWSADERRFPRPVYWDRFLTLVGARGLHFEDVPELRAFRCPDGSHLDVRDQLQFTRALADTMAERGWISSKH